jgi:hypothetical protein
MMAAVVLSREWHRVDGKPVGEGKLLKVENERAVILGQDGITISIPLKQLSLEDAAYVQVAVQRQNQLNEAPANLKISASATDADPDESDTAASTRWEDAFGGDKPPARLCSFGAGIELVGRIGASRAGRGCRGPAGKG